MTEQVMGCQTCKHWHRTNVGAGECRAHPPTVCIVVAGQNMARMTAYPERKASDPTCSEKIERLVWMGDPQYEK